MAPTSMDKVNFIPRIIFRRRSYWIFLDRLGYIRGVVPSNEANKKLLKHLIGVSLLMGSCSSEGHWLAFGKLAIFFALYC